MPSCNIPFALLRQQRQHVFPLGKPRVPTGLYAIECWELFRQGQELSPNASKKLSPDVRGPKQHVRVVGVPNGRPASAAPQPGIALTRHPPKLRAELRIPRFHVKHVPVNETPA